jgi:hypothetical protein
VGGALAGRLPRERPELHLRRFQLIRRSERGLEESKVAQPDPTAGLFGDAFVER